MGSGSPRLSVVIPLYDEEPVVPELLARLRETLARIPGAPHEIVLVDDGSRDGTLARLEAETAADPSLVVVALARNFGHQRAICAGLDYATGDAVVVMDGDLQDSPETIPRFLAEYEKGYDVVYARRVNRKESFLLRGAYFAFYRLSTWLSDVPLPVDAGDFALLSRRAVDAIRRMPERLRYMRGLRAWIGLRQSGIPVEREERRVGKSKYGPVKLVRLAFDGMFAFSVVPLRAAAVSGLAAIAVSVLYVVYALYAKFLGAGSPRGFTSLTMGIVFLSGVQLVFLGVIGEYLSRVYEEVKDRPLYLVDRVIRRSP